MPLDKKMSFVMPAYKSARTIGRAIESLMDQDYKNFEVNVVFDGPDDDALKIVLGYIDKGKPVKAYTIDHAGACTARNYGAGHAVGDYLSFFSSDFIAEPGMLRRWIEAFEDHPDADMIYGGYRLWDLESKPAFYSEPYDLYALTCYNYIDGGFPIKREWWERHPWDADFKSLNDWEWVLRMCLDGMKPVYIPDFTYSAQSPQRGGLSHDSSQNWLERVGQIRKKHGIPDRDICFCSLDYFDEARKLAMATGQEVQHSPAYKPNKFKLVYMIGFNYQRANECAEMLSVGPEARKIIHWMPADIRRLKNARIADLETLADGFKDFGIQSFACTAEDVKFLQQYGFKAKLKFYYAWTGHRVNGQEFKVWLPPDFDDVEKGMPDIPVTHNKDEATCEVLLDRPWGEIAEAQLAGKQVVASAPFEGTWLIPSQRTYPELKTLLVNTLRKLKADGKAPLTKLPREAVNAGKFRKELDRLCR